MFSSKDIIGWIGNIAVIPVDGGFFLVDWDGSKKIFIGD